ncbi:hemerythrin domain-containing protein [Paracoccus aerius]|uniref:Hemerythrin domain-containing protein n=1 Tax=Paracoccus aerius TaxID=1915382 RepID=A0ABS1SAT4_9RHOB|nr:hemerythrin domain-containing protein [Paracoccus aerius]MBL3675837.1 hemerythrin domain-containing protein [Paracoccus aerius]
MTLRQTIQAAPEKAAALITKLAATSNQAVKSRESLYAELSDELSRYVELEEQHLLPLLRKHPETKDLAVNALKGNKDLRASLEKLSGLPKDNDAFLAALADLNKGFQQHVRNERKELLPAILKVLNDDEAATVASDIEGAVKEAETAKRDEKREERAQAKRNAEKAEQAEADERAAAREAKHVEQAEAERQAAEAERALAAEQAVARTQKEAERVARETTEQVAEVMERGRAAAQDQARQIGEGLTERAQQMASDSQEAMTVYRDAARMLAGDVQVVSTTSAVSVQALSDVSSAWMDWFGKAARTNVELSQQLIGSRTLKAAAEAQRAFAMSVMHNWMERRTAMLQIAQRSSQQALNPLQARITETA